MLPHLYGVDRVNETVKQGTNHTMEQIRSLALRAVKLFRNQTAELKKGRTRLNNRGEAVAASEKRNTRILAKRWSMASSCHTRYWSTPRRGSLRSATDQAVLL